MIPDDVEKIIMTKEDYDRNVEQLLLEKIELQKENEKLIEVVRINHQLIDVYLGRINEAIKYIEENTERASVNGENQLLIDQEDIPIILEILKGEENEISNK